MSHTDILKLMVSQKDKLFNLNSLQDKLATRSQSCCVKMTNVVQTKIISWLNYIRLVLIRNCGAQQPARSTAIPSFHFVVELDQFWIRWSPQSTGGVVDNVKEFELAWSREGEPVFKKTVFLKHNLWCKNSKTEHMGIIMFQLTLVWLINSHLLVYACWFFSPSCICDCFKKKFFSYRRQPPPSCMATF